MGFNPILVNPELFYLTLSILSKYRQGFSTPDCSILYSSSDFAHAEDPSPSALVCLYRYHLYLRIMGCKLSEEPECVSGKAGNYVRGLIK